MLLRVRKQVCTCCGAHHSSTRGVQGTCLFPELQSPSLVALTFLGMYSHGGANFLAAPFSAPCSDLGVMLQAAMY